MLNLRDTCRVGLRHASGAVVVAEHGLRHAARGPSGKRGEMNRGLAVVFDDERHGVLGLPEDERSKAEANAGLGKGQLALWCRCRGLPGGRSGLAVGGDGKGQEAAVGGSQGRFQRHGPGLLD